MNIVLFKAQVLESDLLALQRNVCKGTPFAITLKKRILRLCTYVIWGFQVCTNLQILSKAGFIKSKLYNLLKNRTTCKINDQIHMKDTSCLVQ